MTKPLDQMTPCFAARVENLVTSPKNPHRFGLFVKTIRIPHGRMNAGLWWELTDGKGDFWQTDPANLRVVE